MEWYFLLSSSIFLCGCLKQKQLVIIGKFQTCLVHGNVNSCLLLLSVILAEAASIDYVKNEEEEKKNKIV